ncbi:MAG: methyltransferase domain-containing protein [Chloroflexi bacterium]|nr:methyltransferase domain-containing protein [Chloroflexota bacterium]
MTEANTTSTPSQHEPEDTYVYAKNAAVAAVQMRRTAAADADFLLPHLRPGMRLLDAGCGGGSITVGLAGVVAPGEVVGLDQEQHRLDQALALAAERGLSNVRFEHGDIYALPFPDGSFDAAFAHHILQHLHDPLAALLELRRVLRPGGVIGIRDPDEGATLIAPMTPALEELRTLELRLRAHYQTSPFYARDQRRLLREAGFARSEARAVARSAGTLDETREAAANLRARLTGPSAGHAMVALGWLTCERLTALLDEVTAWGERPDAFYASTFCSAVGWG